MLTPLKQFVCDTCGEIINSPEEGWVEWIFNSGLEGEKREIHSFRIVHHFSSSPHSSSNPNGCYQHTKKRGRNDNHLHYFTDEDRKIILLLKFLDIGTILQPTYNGCDIRDMREYVEFVRRLTIPYYEEARLCFNEAKADSFFADSNEILVYKEETLKEVIERYGG